MQNNENKDLLAKHAETVVGIFVRLRTSEIQTFKNTFGRAAQKLLGGAV